MIFIHSILFNTKLSAVFLDFSKLTYSKNYYFKMLSLEEKNIIKLITKIITSKNWRFADYIHDSEYILASTSIQIESACETHKFLTVAYV